MTVVIITPLSLILVSRSLVKCNPAVGAAALPMFWHKLSGNDLYLLILDEYKVAVASILTYLKFPLKRHQ